MAFTLNYDDLLDMTDNIATSVKALKATRDDLLTNLTALHALIDGLGDDDYEAALRKPALDETLNLNNVADTIMLGFTQALAQAIQDIEYPAGDGYIDTFITAEKGATTRLSCYFADLLRSKGFTITPSTVFPPEGTSMGVFTEGGSPEEFVAGTAINTDLYGGAKLQTYVTSKVEASDSNPITVTITGLDENGSVWTGAAEIAKDSAATTIDAVTPTIADTYCASITDITVSANMSAGVFRVESVEDRSI